VYKSSLCLHLNELYEVCNFASNFGKEVLGKVQILKTSKIVPFILCCHGSIGIVAKLLVLTFLFEGFL
jgi:hypothetical protein